MDELLALLIANRGEEGCDIAVKKIKKNFKVKLLSELTEPQLKKLIDKEEQNKPNMIDCNCGSKAYRKGMFYICNKCRTVMG